ncbi:MAG: beta-lactamase family protein [Bacteroidetes bacterium]|nr:beta-lactamase family protein [Bacteroidota bacterium]
MYVYLRFLLAFAFFQANAQIPKLQKDIPDLMQKADIPGLSIAVIRNGKLAYSESYGVMNADTRQPVNSFTVFEAASLSKSVFAYGVLKLVDKGKLDLDTPLIKYLGNDYGVTDSRIKLVTARHCLSHTSGFPNWRELDQSDTLKIHFTPGERWRYSGEGIVYLSKVVEKITGLSLEEFMQQYVLKPLGMVHSSYTWLPGFDTLKTWRHDDLGTVSGRSQKIKGELVAITEEANAAASLSTNAEDYARFLIAVLNGTGLASKSLRQMMAVQVRTNEKYPELAWGLGVGLETMPDGTWFWHWGDNGNGKAFFIASLSTKNAVVYFANASMGLGIAPYIVADAVGGNHPSLENPRYKRPDDPARVLLKSMIAEGATKALPAYVAERKKDTTRAIGNEDMIDIGYALIRLKKNEDAMLVLKQNTLDFPGSWNAWASYAEACLYAGDKGLAIECCKKSLELNPKSEKGKRIMERLLGNTK